jgi:hypothetical protein
VDRETAQYCAFSSERIEKMSVEMEFVDELLEGLEQDLWSMSDELKKMSASCERLAEAWGNTLALLRGSQPYISMPAFQEGFRAYRDAPRRSEDGKVIVNLMEKNPHPASSMDETMWDMGVDAAKRHFGEAD